MTMKNFDVQFTYKKGSSIFTDNTVVTIKTDEIVTLENKASNTLYNKIRNKIIDQGYKVEYIHYIAESEDIGNMEYIKDNLNNNYSELFEGSIFDFKDCFILRTESIIIIELYYLNYKAASQVDIDMFKDALKTSFTLKQLFNNIVYYNSEELEDF